MPFFSIIIPVYNVAPYLRECLDSILVQTFGDWEAICVDDGSTDGSGAILDEYVAKDGRFKAIHKENGGVSLARNVALEMARGEYIVFVDADDVIKRDWLRVFHKVVETDACDVVRGALRYWYGDDSYKTADTAQYSVVARHQGRQEVRDWGVAEVLESGYSWLNCVRREIIVGVKFPVGVRILEDCIFSAYVMARANSVSVIDYEGYLYRMRENSAIHVHGVGQSLALDIRDVFVALKDFWGDLIQSEGKSMSLSAVRRAIVNFVRRHAFGVASGRRFLSLGSDSRSLALAIRDLHVLGALDLSELPLNEQFAILVYIKTCCWWMVQMICKLEARRN